MQLTSCLGTQPGYGNQEMLYYVSRCNSVCISLWLLISSSKLIVYLTIAHFLFYDPKEVLHWSVVVTVAFP